MKIIFPRMETMQFHNAYDGGSKFIQYLAEELAKLGVDVEIVSTKVKDSDMKRTEHNRVKYVFLNMNYAKKKLSNLYNKYIFSKNLRKYLEKTDFDVLHSTEMFSYSYLHKKKRKPVIFQCWALEAWPIESLKPSGLKRLYNALVLRHFWQYCIDNSDSVASDGEHQLYRLKKIGVPRQKIWFIPNGVTFRKIQNYKKNFENLRKKLGIGKKDLIILSVCQIAPDKGIDDIINGFSILKKQIRDARLILVGKGILEPMMHGLFKKRNLIEEKDVFHRKNVPEKELYDYFFSSDIFVSGTLSEDFMISIQEGMACGMPIVSSSQPFLVKNDVNGYVAGLKNPRGIAEGILKIYKSGKRKMKKMGQESKKMARQYDYDILAKSALKEYEKLIKR